MKELEQKAFKQQELLNERRETTEMDIQDKNSMELELIYREEEKIMRTKKSEEQALKLELNLKQEQLEIEQA